MRSPGGRRRRAGVAALLLTACLCARSMAAEPAIDTRLDGESVVITASSAVDADPDVAWRVLTDYARYAEFIPGLRSSRVLHRSGTSVSVEQTGSARLGPLEFPIAIVYEIAESPPNALRSRGTIADVGTLESLYAVQTSGRSVRLEYVGRLVTRPSILQPLERAVGRQTIARQFRALVEEIERVGSTAAPGPAGPGVRPPS